MNDATFDSLAAAKAQQAADREQVYQRTGVRILANDTLQHPAAYTIICPRCLAPVSSATNGLATRALARHLVIDHARKGVA